jgi:hypothetical protein
MALRGKLSDIGLVDVFRLMAENVRTGVLRVSGPAGQGSVWFRDGEVFFAQSDRATAPLGERLVADGRITQPALEQALELRAAEPSGGWRIGEILVAEGSITAPVLSAFMREQIQDRVCDLLASAEGEFSFEAAEVPAEFDIGLSMSMENILMESARRLEAARVPSDMVCRMSAGQPDGTFDIALKPDEWRVLLSMDGTHTIAQAAAGLGLPESDVARTVGGLLAAGVLESVEAPVPHAASAEPTAAAPVAVEPVPEVPTAVPAPVSLQETPEAVEAPAPRAASRTPYTGPVPEVLTLDESLEVPALAVDGGRRLGSTSSDPDAVMRQLYGGLGDEVSAITGAEASLTRPLDRPVAHRAGQHVLRRDPHVDRVLAQRVIAIIENLWEPV